METHDKSISELLKGIDEGKIQLPDFQRSWVWDDDRIKALLASVIHNYPIGAVMFLAYGNENVRFKYRTIEGSTSEGKDVVPTHLILDGQQRLTALYSALFSQAAVKTCLKIDRKKTIYRYYYLDIEKSLDLDVEDEELIVSVPDSKRKTSDFGRNIELDLTTQEMEFKNKLIPLNRFASWQNVSDWTTNFQRYYDFDSSICELCGKFNNRVVQMTMGYQIPVISLGKETPKEAVCRVFENVNTGGVPLTVFELVVASYSADDFELRKDWEERKEKFFNGDILNVVTATDFLTALTLLSTYKRKLIDDKVAVSCKKKDVLNLSLTEYKKYADVLTEGFVEAERILQEERIFTSRDLPYTTQLIPIAAICALLVQDHRLKIVNVKNKIKQWYWCGVFGELYGSANETRYANDIVQVIDWLSDDSNPPKTLQDFYFNPTRLLGLQTKQSAAYKGIMALILKNHSKDFISGSEMDFVAYKSENIDIHHIFPRDYCEKSNLPRAKWNSIVNKTPISYSTNREIGGVAPSEYISKIEKKRKVSSADLDLFFESHWLVPNLLRSDAFDQFIVARAKALLDAIQNATGKTITGRDSEEVIEAFGAKLL